MKGEAEMGAEIGYHMGGKAAWHIPPPCISRLDIMDGGKAASPSSLASCNSRCSLPMRVRVRVMQLALQPSNARYGRGWGRGRGRIRYLISQG